MADETELIDELDDGEQHGFAEYTAEELLELAQSNAQATIMATALFLHQRGISLDDWARSLGETFALAWDADRGWEAGEFMDAMLTNLRSMGATVVSAELGIDRAEATVTGFPDPALSELFSIDTALTARFNDAAKVLAERAGIEWEWKVERTRSRFTARVAAP